MQRARWLWLLAAGLLVGCGTPGPDGPADSFGLEFPHPLRTSQGAVVFVVDGVNATIFREMLDAGELPAIRKYFVDRGLYCPAAVANTPSVTLANLTSIVTGAFPGHHGVVGINWFDRNQLIWRNYETIAQKDTLDGDYIFPTIYEQFPDRTTFSIFLQPHRGATKFVENWTSAGPPFFFGWFEFVDRLTLFRLNIVAEVARVRNEWPAITFLYLLAPDFRAYGDGTSSDAYRTALKHTDYQIGRVLGDLERARLLDKLLIAFVSDHGHADVTQHFPIEEFLEDKLHIDVADKHLWEETPFEKRLGYYRRYSCVLYGSGDRYWTLCLRKPVFSGKKLSSQRVRFEEWPVRPSPAELRKYPTARPPAAGASSHTGRVDLQKRLIQLEAVDVLTYAAGADRVRVVRKDGEVEFRQPGGRGGDISYHLVSGEDPLGYDASLPAAVRNGEPISPRRWLALTARTDYPDLPAQILAYFRARRAGDIAIFAAPGWDFASQHRSGHGGLRGDDLHVPLLIAGPGVPHGTIDTARTVDLAATLLKLLGRPLPESLDGQPLVENQETP